MLLHSVAVSQLLWISPWHRRRWPQRSSVFVRSALLVELFLWLMLTTGGEGVVAKFFCTHQSCLLRYLQKPRRKRNTSGKRCPIFVALNLLRWCSWGRSGGFSFVLAHLFIYYLAFFPFLFFPACTCCFLFPEYNLLIK